MHVSVLPCQEVMRKTFSLSVHTRTLVGLIDRQDFHLWQSYCRRHSHLFRTHTEGITDRWEADT